MGICLLELTIVGANGSQSSEQSDLAIELDVNGDSFKWFPRIIMFSYARNVGGYDCSVTKLPYDLWLVFHYLELYLLVNNDMWNSIGNHSLFINLLAVYCPI